MRRDIDVQECSVPGLSVPGHQGDLRSRLSRREFPRASTYDPRWLLENAMGPHVLWLAEWLAGVMTLHPGMRVLDLGCGRAVSSIFLAREFGLTVWAADLWISPGENWRRIAEAGLESRVLPIHAEAHALPFAPDYFDAIVSLDAWHYFATDDLYLGYGSSFVRPGGQLGIVVPGVQDELAGGVPDHVRPYWQWEFCSLHSPAWWRGHVEKTGLLEVEVADWMLDGWRRWLEWAELCAEAGPESFRGAAAREAEMLRVDGGRSFGFTRLIAHRPERELG
jgi:SAM-dependent methyltransferase